MRSREARALFADVPAIKELDEPCDELWWVKKLMQREQVRDFMKS